MMTAQVKTEEYLRIGQQAKLLDVSPRTIWRLAKNDPSFPAELQLSPGVHGVRVRLKRDLEIWIASKRKGARS